MKSIVLLCVCSSILLGIVSESSACSKKKSPAPATGTPGSGNSGEKPGTCARPYNGRRRRSVDVVHSQFLNEAILEDADFKHFIEKREANPDPQSQGGNPWTPPPSNGNGGSQGGNPWKPPPTPPPILPPRPECYNDYQCINNKKCCNGFCQTPSFVG